MSGILRSYKRNMAKLNLKKKGFVKVCSDHVVYNPILNCSGRVGSFFSRNWRSYIK